MNPELAKFLDGVQKRAFSGTGIGTAAGYVLTVVAATEADGFCRQFPGKSAKDFRAMLKAAGERFVYRPKCTDPLTAVTKAAKGGKAGEFVTFGKPTRKDADKGMNPGSVMDFENILTTKQQDRDGDVLHPKGCKVDPSAPLLWQHIPTEPIGKMVQVVEQDENHVKTHCAIADTPLGNLSAKLVEFGALRISHGFKPLKWKALSESGDDSGGGMITGWEVEECEVMEISLVSVPANVGAVITAYQKGKKDFDLCPLAKAWAERLWSERPAVVVGGFGGQRWKSAKASPVVVNVNVNNPAGTGKKSGKPTKPAKTKADDPPEDDDEDGKEKEEKPTDDPKVDDDGGKAGDAAGNVLSDVAERAQAMADDEGLSSEVRARASVVCGILTDVGANIASAMEAISAAAESGDLTKLNAAHMELTSACGKKLQRAGAELASLLQASDDLDETAAGAVQEMAEAIAASLSGIMPEGSPDTGKGDDGEGGGEWVELEGDDKDDESDDDADKSDDEEEDTDDDADTDDEEAKDESDDDSDEDDSELEEESDDDKDEEAGYGDDEDTSDKDEEADDDSDDEEKDDDEEEEKDDSDDDDNEEKDGAELDPEDENPEADGEEHPGVPKAGDDDDREEKDDDADDEPAPKGKKKKPKKAADLTAIARTLAAGAISGDPVNLAAHRKFAAAVLAGGDIDPSALLMYRRACGAVLKKLAAGSVKK